MRWITALLTWFAADPQAIDTEQPRAAACVCAARCSLIEESEKHAKQNQDTQATMVEDDSSGQATKRDDSNRPTAAARGYCSARHRAWRAAVLTAAAWQCQQCARVCSEKGEAHADHISPVVHGTELCQNGLSRYDIKAGQCLCIRCHARKTLKENR